MSVVAAYAAVHLVWVYGLLNRSDAAADEPWLVLGYAVLGVVNAGTGLALGRWWAVGLPFGIVPLAVPAGYVPDGRPEFPIWFGLFFLAPFAAVLVAAGVVAAKRLGRHTTT